MDAAAVPAAAPGNFRRLTAVNPFTQPPALRAVEVTMDRFDAGRVGVATGPPNRASGSNTMGRVTLSVLFATAAERPPVAAESIAALVLATDISSHPVLVPCHVCWGIAHASADESTAL
jgi:hypothetical protein